MSLEYHKYLTNQGYLIKKDKITKDQIKAIETDLKFQPMVLKAFQSFKKVNSFLTYKESPNYYFVPRFYGSEKFGKPRKNLLSEGLEMSHQCRLDSKYKIRPYQEKGYNVTIDQLKEHGGGILSVFCGWGKCLAKDTKILMFDRSLRNVQDINVNDLLMGNDGTPRTILSTCIGNQEMYEIIPQSEHFIKFGCNRSHILSLIYINDTSAESGKIYNISIDDYIKLSLEVKGHLYLYKMSEKGQNKLFDDPYGDGQRFMIDENSLNPLYKFANRQTYEKLINGAIEIYNNSAFDIKKTQSIDSLVKKMENINDISKFELKMTEPNGTYYGFTIDGDRLFILEDLTVTHNTAAAIITALEIHGKTLILAHKEDLLDQWRGEIMTFTNGNAKIGTIQQNKIDVENCDFVLGMLQSISKREYDPKLFKDFRLLIVDECHHVGSEIFSRTLDKTSFKYTLGLSATPYRKDNLTTVFTNYLGPIHYIEKRSERKDTMVLRIKLNSTTAYYEDEYFCNGTKNTAKMVMKLSDYDNRNKFIVNIVKKMYNGKLTPEPRKMLLLSKSRNHLTTLYELIGSLNLTFNGKAITCGYYWGRSARSNKSNCMASIPIQLKKRQLVYNREMSKSCFLSKDGNSQYCYFHRYLMDYTEDQLNNLTLCKTVGCYYYHFKSELSLVCEICSSKIIQDCDLIEYLNVSHENKPKTNNKNQHKQMLEDSKECDIIFGTNDIASEALNIPGLNTLLQATPQQEVEQTVGRILRRQTMAEFNPPLIIDLIDQCGNFGNHAGVRLRTYKKEGFKVINLLSANLEKSNYKWDKFGEHVQKLSFNEVLNETDNDNDSDQCNLVKVASVCLL